MMKDQRRFQSGNREIRVPNPNSGLNIIGPIIISKDENEMTILSSRCTHLGCEINKIENGEIVCPCHGSRYDKTGNPTKGPSIKALKKLDYSIDQTTNEVVVKLS
jgi:Rieske Fe-S protein